MNQRTKQLVLRISLAVCILLTPLLLTTASLVVDQGTVAASSHREAPLISQDQFADNTDTYVFVSPANKNNLVLAASWIPFEGPEGGPNYFEWGKDVTYNLYVDNDGDALADFTYQLTSRVEVAYPNTFLYNVAPLSAPSDDDWNRRQYITLKELREDGTTITLVNDKLTTPVNIGNKSTPNFKSLSNKARFRVSSRGDRINVYAGQTDDAFWVDLQIFDLLTLRGQAPPIGYDKGNNTPVDSVSGFNVHSLVIELPINRLKANGDPVLGVWATSQRPKSRVLNSDGLGSLENSGDAVQVSRLGMPLVNEVVLPYALKDAFNSIPPSADVQIYIDALLGSGVGDLLQRSVEDPEIGRLLCALYGVPLPGDADDNCSTEVDTTTPRSGRGDIFDIFLTGMVLANEFTIQTKNGPVTLPTGFNVNRPANPNIVGGVVPAEMIRINTNIKGDLCSPTPSRLGILGGDACGFPNGRRLTDDTVEIELLAVAGAAYEVLDDRDASFTFNPAFIAVLDDGVDTNDVPFRSSFPFMALAQSGQEHFHQNATDGPDDDVVAAASAADDESEYTDANAIDALINAINSLFLPFITQ